MTTELDKEILKIKEDDLLELIIKLEDGEVEFVFPLSCNICGQDMEKGQAICFNCGYNKAKIPQRTVEKKRRWKK